MNKDLLLFILYLIPVLWTAVIDQERLIYRKVFLKHLAIALLLLAIGTLPEIIEWREKKSLSYFGSQMLFIFLMLYLIITSIYARLGKPTPEFTEMTENINDKLASGTLYIGMISLPFLIDSFIVQQLHDYFFTR
ncbi:MAG: hypothetical protein ACTHJT_11930 [Cytophaga sp.]|uniref:hypothetical protein n=1 Tax=Cytophaga sp. TaxID=29535 RepID=UPI003F820401